MVAKSLHVNGECKDSDTFGGRLVAERDRLGLKQVDVCARTRVSRTSQNKYENNDRRPDADYLKDLDELGFDVMYLLTGERSSGSLSAELQNLIDAYQDASTALRDAALAVLLSPLLDVRSAREIPGYARYTLQGQEDARHVRWLSERRTDYGAIAPPEPTAGAGEQKDANLAISGGAIGQVVQGDAAGGGKVVVKPDAGDLKKRR